MRAAGWMAAALLAGTPGLEASFPPGTGSRFQVRLGDTPAADLVITVAEVKGRRVSVEYYLATPEALVPSEMWQHFVLEVPEQGPVKLLAGYLEHPSLAGAERIPDALLTTRDSLGLEAFLAPRDGTPGVQELGTETITVPAGTVSTRHFVRHAGDREVHFWVSDEAKPVGLVKLTSTGRKPGERYSLELAALVKNATARIDPARARPASDKLKGILARDLPY